MCIPLVLRVTTVTGGRDYSYAVLGSVSCGGGVVNVGICGCMLGVGEGGSFVFGVSCVVCVIGVADGKVRGGVHPLHWLMCSCVLSVCSGWRFVRSRGCFFRVGLGRGGLRVCRREVCCLRLDCESSWFEDVGAEVLCVCGRLLWSCY